jgi:tRNA pseudouridine55 synthase
MPTANGYASASFRLKPVNGILNIDKPAGITSHDVVSRVRRIMKTKRVGHTGTLDPFATGVMVILTGQATRLAQFLDKDEKEYEALIRFGFETDTGDRTGVRGAGCGLRTEEISALLERTDWHNIFEGFRGEIEQTPPMYSAKKVDGKKLYELSESAIRNPQSAIDTVRIFVACSAGTYIRTLAEDIGRKVGIGAHLEELRRTRAGKFVISQSVTLDQLAELDDPRSAIVPMEAAVSHIRTIGLTDDRIAKTRNGLSTRVFDMSFIDGDPVQMLGPDGSLIAIGYFNAAENTVQPKVVMV